MVRFYDHSKHTNKAKLFFLFLAASGLFLVMFGCKKRPGENIPNSKTSDKTQVILNKPLADFQKQLLDIAIETATVIPVKPHIKDRSKAQEDVVSACLKLDQPKRALGYIDKIDDWRRGDCYAGLALYCVQHGQRDNVQKYLENAKEIADKENSQEWRKDTIRVKIAKTYSLLGDTKQAGVYEANVVESETGKVEAVKARTGDVNSFDEQVKAIDEFVARGDFDITRNAQDAYAQLFDRFYADPNRRSLIEEKINKSLVKFPVFIRIELLEKLAGFSLDHNDTIKAISLIDDAQDSIDKNTWQPEHRIPIEAKLTELRFQAGDKQKALNSAAALRDLYNAEGKQIVDIYRAGALRPLAEAYQAMGDANEAMTIYKRAIEEGALNPNSRPRAEDLSATCCSMALSAVEPDAELWARIRQINEALGDPW